MAQIVRNRNGEIWDVFIVSEAGTTELTVVGEYEDAISETNHMVDMITNTEHQSIISINIVNRVVRRKESNIQ